MTADIWERRADALWQLLDDIDTMGDVAKSDSAMYRRLVESIHRKRHDYAQSHDGYTLVWKDTTAPPDTFGESDEDGLLDAVANGTVAERVLTPRGSER